MLHLKPIKHHLETYDAILASERKGCDALREFFEGIVRVRDYAEEQDITLKKLALAFREDFSIPGLNYTSNHGPKNDIEPLDLIDIILKADLSDFKQLPFAFIMEFEGPIGEYILPLFTLEGGTGSNDSTNCLYTYGWPPGENDPENVRQFVANALDRFADGDIKEIFYVPEDGPSTTNPIEIFTTRLEVRLNASHP